MTLTTAVLAIAGEQIEQLLQGAVRAVRVGQTRQPVTPFPGAKRAVQTNDDIWKGRERLFHDGNKSRTYD